MAYKEIVSLDADVTIAIGGVNRKTNKKNPTQVEGFFLGTRQVESKKAKSGFAAIHFFQTANGTLGVWGKTDMDRKLATATPGAMTLVKFEKMQATPNGEMYKYSVAQDDSNTIEVALSNTTPQNDEYNDNESTEDSYDNEDPQDEDAQQTAALAAAERKAKVQSLLNGKGKTAKN